MDEQAIKSTLNECRGYQSDYIDHIYAELEEETHPETREREHLAHQVSQGIAGHPLIDIGAGNNWQKTANRFLGNTPYQPCALAASSYTGVDPFQKAVEEERIRVLSVDGLTFLRSQPSDTANIIISGIDLCIIPSIQYIRELVREAYRVTRNNGLLFTTTHEVTRPASMLFGEDLTHYLTMQTIGIFRKGGSA